MRAPCSSDMQLTDRCALSTTSTSPTDSPSCNVLVSSGGPSGWLLGPTSCERREAVCNGAAILTADASDSAGGDGWLFVVGGARHLDVDSQSSFNDDVNAGIRGVALAEQDRVGRQVERLRRLIMKI